MRRVAGWLLPEGASPDAAPLLAARSLRAFADGLVSVLLPAYLLALGYDGLQVGAIATATLLGSAALTLALGLVAHRFDPRPLLLAATLLMAATGLGFASLRDFAPLLAVALLGTLNPASGDVSVFLPLEQPLVARAAPAARRTALFARYALVGALGGALGALCAGLSDLLGERLGLPRADALGAAFWLYALLGLAQLPLYARLPRAGPAAGPPGAPLREARRVVLTLTALFALDAFGSGLVVQSLLALWLFQRFDLSVAAAGTLFFWTGVLSAASYPVAARLGARFGLVNTMVFTHLPANVLLLAAPFTPSLPLALACLLGRAALSQMDVPVRTSYVMAVVPPAERAAAASVTAVPRGLASAASPLLAGALLAASPFGWPLVLAGAVKVAYDLLLLALFAGVRPPEEQPPAV